MPGYNRRGGWALGLAEGLGNIGNLLQKQKLLEQERRDKANAEARGQLKALQIYTPGVRDEDLQSLMSRPDAASITTPEFQDASAALPPPSRLPMPELSPASEASIGGAPLPRLAGVPTPPAPRSVGLGPIESGTSTEFQGPLSIGQEIEQAQNKVVMNPLEKGYGAPVPIMGGKGFYQPAPSEQTTYARTIQGIEGRRAAAEQFGLAETGRNTRAQLAQTGMNQRQQAQFQFLKDNPNLMAVDIYDPVSKTATKWAINPKNGERVKDLGSTIPSWSMFINTYGTAQEQGSAQAAAKMMFNLQEMQNIEKDNPEVEQLAANSINDLAALKETPLGLGNFLEVLARTNGLQVDDPKVQHYGTALYNYLVPVIQDVGGRNLTANEIAVTMRARVGFRNEDPASLENKRHNRILDLLTAAEKAGPSWSGPKVPELASYFGVVYNALPGVGRTSNVSGTVDNNGPVYRRPR